MAKDIDYEPSFVIMFTSFTIILQSVYHSLLSLLEFFIRGEETIFQMNVSERFTRCL